MSTIRARAVPIRVQLDLSYHQACSVKGSLGTLPGHPAFVVPVRKPVRLTSICPNYSYEFELGEYQSMKGKLNVEFHLRLVPG